MSREIVLIVDCRPRSMPAMQNIRHSTARLHDPGTEKTAAGALAMARDWLEAGNMAEAAKWAAIAARLGDAEKLIKTA
jgi:hypothetical protein